MRHLRTGLAVAAAALAAAVGVGCGDDDSAGAAAAGGGERPTLRFAVTEMEGLEELQREFGAFERRLEQAADVELELFPVADRTAAAAALDADRVDLVFTGPAEYVVMRQRTGAQPVVAIRRPGYRSCVWTKRGSGVSALSDLRGRSIAMEDVGSTSAHLGPAKLLLDAGVDPQRDVEVRLVGDAMQEALERGDVDAVGAGCHDYEAFMENEDRAAYPLVTEGPELPADVIVAREGLPGRDVARVRRAFERHWPGLRAAMAQGEENAKFRDAELVAVPSDADYDVVREMYRAVGVEDFTRFVGD